MLDQSFHITTPRLQLSYLDSANDTHMAFVVHLSSTPESIAVATQAGFKPPKRMTIPEARAALEPATERLSATGYGRYIISTRDPSIPFPDQQEREYIGYVSMQLNRYPSIACPTIPDIGFILLAKNHGKGYASEACSALMQHFKEAWGDERFAGYTHPENVQSQKLFARLGFENRGIEHVGGVVGDGSAARVAVWLKDVRPETKLSELGIGPGTGAEEEGRLERLEKALA